ncbi:OLC1v1035125C1 [Oldenlandia corymbosa var. corymbosa]|uniref:OLC1v1035125C1 n=1 Tax=Oldenlandia corymbosa var. corymbosa TaxID=529605 RepID=A0AAV1CS79_OLDCO|nr:OLC1v1035125C1 [Oldenlandia corymbosa var. corymbosa]
MDVQKCFHMTGGIGKTSYSQNSHIQKNNSDKAKWMTVESVQQIYLTTTPKSFGIADLGCSSGPNTLTNIRDIMDEIEAISRTASQPAAPEFRVYLNDLHTNDFNALFQALPKFYSDLKNRQSSGSPPSLYLAACPGTFYGRLFPDEYLHLIYSSNSLHWLSKVPPGIYDDNGKSINKGSVYITEKSPPEVAEAYVRQFQEDFSLFLHLRSKELVSGGGMVLILTGRNNPNHIDGGNSFFWEILSRSLATLVQKGIVEEEKLDSYEVHFYAPSKEELEDLVRKEESLKLERIEMIETETNTGGNGSDGISYGRKVAMTVRAVQESMIAHHFGEEILNELFEVYGRLIDEEMVKQGIRAYSTAAVVLRKL